MKLNWTKSEYEGHMALNITPPNKTGRFNVEKDYGGVILMVEMNHKYNNLVLLYWSFTK